MKNLCILSLGIFLILPAALQSQPPVDLDKDLVKVNELIRDGQSQKALTTLDEIARQCSDNKCQAKLICGIRG